MKNILFNLIFCLAFTPLFGQQLNNIIIDEGPCNGAYTFTLDGADFVLSAENTMDPSQCSFESDNAVNLGSQNTLEIVSPNGTNADILNGISTLDMVILMRGILMGQFESVIEMIAGDWDRDGVLSTYDLITIRRIILGIDNVANYPLYYVVSSNLTTSDINPYDMTDLNFSQLTFADTEVDNGTLGVSVYKVGDLNNSATLNNEEVIEARSEARLEFDNIQLEAGQGYNVKFSIDHNADISGFLFRLNSNEVELLNVNSEFTGDEFMWNNTEQGIAVSYLTNHEKSKVDFSINLKAFANGNLSDFISLDDSYQAELVDTDLVESSLSLNGVISNNDNIIRKSARVFPNPVEDVLFIEHNGGVQTDIFLYDVSGKELLHQRSKSNKHQLNIPESLNSGVYLVKIESENSTETLRVMIK